MKVHSKRGQAMIEYVIVFVLLMGAAGVFAAFLYTVRQQSDRTLGLVASDYP